PGLPNRYVTRIAIDKNNHNKVFVTFGGFTSDNLYVTTNGGSSWADSSGSLPNLPLRTIVIHPNDSNKIYVGAELGIYESTNGGSSWNVSSTAPTNTAVDELFWMNTTLVAATHGRGIFTQETVASTFSDVATNYWAYSFIERLYNSGITSGCAAGLYCPEDSVTRGQMAVFLEKGIHGSGFAPANVAPTFNDTAGHWAEDWIEALKTDGITSGCLVGYYCPENPVTRAQMAVFLLKAKHGSSYTPPAVGADTGFTDVAVDYWAAAWIKQLAAEGITGGCAAGLYCPENAVTRAQMAVFLVKAFNLP
ncbi:MAG TPA: S-layer homology domain-containing protein, partial [Anaerolineales bacterium]|nr:S-layer homology domain-containing protein [Anaerolineales bacterium]